LRKKRIVLTVYYQQEILIIFNFLLDGKTIQKVVIASDLGNETTTESTETGFILKGNRDQIRFDIEIDTQDFSMVSVKRILSKPAVVRDCFDLGT
jgi:hypothetical protein